MDGWVESRGCKRGMKVKIYGCGGGGGTITMFKCAIKMISMETATPTTPSPPLPS